MPDWQPREDAPVSFSLGEQFLALVTGDPDWAWLGEWIPFMGTKLYVTEDFCSAGPPPEVELDLLDFITGNRNPLAQLIDQAKLVSKLNAIAQTRVFGAYCELPSEEGFTCIPWDEVTTTIPSGYTHFRVTLLTGGTGGVPDSHVSFQVGGSWIEVFDGRGNFGAVGQERTYAAPAGATNVTFWDNSTGDTRAYSWCQTGSFVPYVPTVQPSPVGVVQPESRTYDDLDDIGAELDRQELKLDTILANLRALTISLVIPPDAPLSSELLEDGVPFPLVQAAGVVITLTGIPASVSEDFGVPVRLHNAGRLSFQTANGYLPSVEITHTPFVVQPLPVGVTHILTHVIPPTVATVQVLPQLV